MQRRRYPQWVARSRAATVLLHAQHHGVSTLGDPWPRAPASFKVNVTRRAVLCGDQNERMWIPKTEDDIREVVEGRLIHEHELLEFKRELSGKGLLEDASDIAAMSACGGVVIYGVSEKPWRMTPIDGVIQLRERLDQAAQHLVTGRLAIDIRLIPCGAPGDDRGYLVVVVPASAQAPHGVRIHGEVRFYGRGATGRRPLTQDEIDALYERRQRWSVDREAMLTQAVDSLPEPLAALEGRLVVIVRPLGAGMGFLDRLSDGEGRSAAEALQAICMQASSAWPNHRGFRPDFGELGSWVEVPRGFRSSTQRLGGQLYPRTFLALCVYEDGQVELVTLCATIEDESHHRLIAEEMIALHTARALAFAGIFLERALYVGQVDVGLLVDGLKGAISYRAYGPGMFPPSDGQTGYEESIYRRTTRATLDDLSDPIALAGRLLQPLSRVTVGEDYDLAHELRGPSVS